MSSIEKAMDKLSGVSTEPETDAEDIESSEKSQSDSASTEAVQTSTEQAPATASTPIENEPAQAAEPEPEIASNADRQNKQSIWIDFERLKAAGNLTPESAFARDTEEYQFIKRRILGNVALGKESDEYPANLIMVTSSVPGEGKTFTSMNLSMSLTIERDHTILVVDTDLVKRDLSRQLNLVERPGLFDYLDHRVEDIAEVIYRTNVPNLAIIPAGRYTDASTELLASSRMADLVQEFATRYNDRVVLFDTPPLLATTTAVALAPLVGQILVVVEANETKTTTLDEALSTIDRNRITGLILNKARAVAQRSYDYYGYYRKPSEQQS